METIYQVNDILQSFRIKADCLSAHQIDGYTFYDLRLHPHSTVREIQKYSDEISLALKKSCKPSIRILHELGVVRLEFGAPSEKPLQLFDLFTNDHVPSGSLIALLGQKVDGNRIWMDISQNPHMIIAGTTGSGKSTLLHNIIANMLNYNDCIMYLMDPKNIEFYEYDRRIKQRNITVAYTYEEAMFVMDSLIATMEERYRSMRSGHSSDFPYILLMIDEFVDLIMQDINNQFFDKLCRLSQKCRAARISIVLATQRPSADIIGGIIKANFPTRIACRVASHVDSKVVLDITGAEDLLGKGDALLRDNFRHMERFQVAYTNATEVCNYFGNHG